ncbi:MAG TPA: heme-binding protein [Candidatus Pseudomonas excrementavium]|uniref:GlcG/HbpS family heme-binding protein n=1 Tax=Halopseudomonas bauzanensis TaxID=653930 RepID=UPI001C3BF98A|nr:heme-binding protein [Halopseudomonas bauzanensis]HIZ49512.1 heme-binding protein [Candidatus Pseudomonas excrementavium]
MLSKPVLTLEEANRMIDAAFAEADQNEWKVTVAVVDDGGHILAMRRMDGCAPIASYIAPQKARSAALGRRDTSEFEAMINGGRTAFLSAPEVTGLLEGGVPLKVEGQVVAAIGVSGVKPDQDAQVAKAGIAAL